MRTVDHLPFSEGEVCNLPGRPMGGCKSAPLIFGLFLSGLILRSHSIRQTKLSGFSEVNLLMERATFAGGSFRFLFRPKRRAGVNNLEREFENGFGKSNFVFRLSFRTGFSLLLFL